MRRSNTSRPTGGVIGDSACHHWFRPSARGFFGASGAFMPRWAISAQAVQYFCCDSSQPSIQLFVVPTVPSFTVKAD
ncbi:MAG: hypothetical protein FD132_1909 [bacterium]|nr:MAG: hypothetical protein FD132_1909 [bacterium]